MLQGFRTYKERRNPSYKEEVMARRSFTTKPARHQEAYIVNLRWSDF